VKPLIFRFHILVLPYRDFAHRPGLTDQICIYGVSKIVVKSASTFLRYLKTLDQSHHDGLSSELYYLNLSLPCMSFLKLWEVSSGIHRPHQFATEEEYG